MMNMETTWVKEAKSAYQSVCCNVETVSEGEMSGVKAEVIKECDD